MVHQIFDPSTVTLDDFIIFEQIGSGEELNYFRGIAPYQRGYGRQRGAGVGDVLRFLWRAILPKIKTAGAALGREALSTGARVLDNVERGERISKPVLINEVKKGVDNILEKGGIGRQFGTGIRRKSIKRKRRENTIIGKTIPKSTIKRRKRSDVFGGLF
jgi:hypothetical protein